MTDFKVGDRVRATLGENVLVGDVIRVWFPVIKALGEPALELHVIEDAYVVVRPDNGWHIEKVSPPLPTKVGAIVRRANGELFVRDADPGPLHWMTLSGSAGGRNEKQVSEGGFEVIFEGVDQ